jgi:hypothetical protein
VNEKAPANHRMNILKNENCASTAFRVALQPHNMHALKRTPRLRWNTHNFTTSGISPEAVKSRFFELV